MRVRIEVQTDDGRSQLRFIVTAKQGAACLHQITRYGGLEARDLALRELAAWLATHGYPVPEDSRGRVFFEIFRPRLRLAPRFALAGFTGWVLAMAALAVLVWWWRGT